MRLVLVRVLGLVGFGRDFGLVGLAPVLAFVCVHVLAWPALPDFPCSSVTLDDVFLF